MIPLIELKYHSDLYETIETFNKYCLNNDVDTINDLDVKDTYMWNMGNYLYDFDTVDGYFEEGKDLKRVLETVKIYNTGSGYTVIPNVEITGGGGSGAVANAVLEGKVKSIKINKKGSGYKIAPSVDITGGGGSGAEATAFLSKRSIMSIKVNKGGSGYKTKPTVKITSKDDKDIYEAKDITINKEGVITRINTYDTHGYINTPSVDITGGGGSGAEATVTLVDGSIDRIEVTNGGSGYTSNPTVKIGAGASADASADAIITYGVVKIDIVDSGSGYTSDPTVKISRIYGDRVNKKDEVEALATAILSNKTYSAEKKNAVTEIESKLYMYYLKMSLTFLLVMITFLIVFLIYVFYFRNFEMCITESDDIQIKGYLRYCGYALFLYVLLFIIFFSLILKKTTELYKKDDTLTYEYIMLMKSLDIILKENKILDTNNEKIIKILERFSKNKIKDIAYVAINNKELLYELSKVQKGTIDKVIYATNKNLLIQLKDIDRLAYYNSDESKNKVKDKVADIFRFIYAYAFFLIVPIYILSISLKGNYIYLLGTIMAMIIFSVTVYNMYNTLQ
jgi:hypothetical protein